MMTVMLIRRHLRRTAAATSTTSPPTHQQIASTAISYSVQPQFPTHPLKFRMTYSSPTRAMRYYRVWIYTCNAVLFVCVIGFIIVACKVVVADPRRTLIPDFTLTHPSLLYAYFALVMQSGFLQLIGCLGARNLNERLLNVYWCLLLILLISDVLLGLFWVYHFEYIVTQMRPVLKQRFRSQYGSDSDFTQLWNMVQRDDHCCGVEGYNDFHQNNSLVNWVTASVLNEATTDMPTTILPASCCEEVSIKPPKARRNQVPETSTATSSTIVPPLPPIFATAETIAVTDQIVADGITIRCSVDHQVFYTTGCEKRLLTWLRSSLDILFVLGYCVISFLKLCFLGILRYEIREMIQKIRILQSEHQNNAECQDSSLKSQQIRKYDHNGSVVGVSQLLLERRTSDRGSGASIDDDDQNSIEDEDVELSATSKRCKSHENLRSVSNQTTPAHLNPSNQLRHFSLFNDTGNDSDTNSHCALIVPDEFPKSAKCRPFKSSAAAAAAAATTTTTTTSSTNYEFHELQDMDKSKTSRNRHRI